MEIRAQSMAGPSQKLGAFGRVSGAFCWRNRRGGLSRATIGLRGAVLVLIQTIRRGNCRNLIRNMSELGFDKGQGSAADL